MSVDTQRKKGISTLIGGFLVMLYWGCLYIPGNINPYLLAYFRQFDDSLTSISVFVIIPLELVVMTICFPIGSYLTSIQVNGRLQMAVAIYVGLAAIFFSSFCTNYWMFFILYGGGFGLSNGLAYIVPIYACWKYFPHNKGLVSGIILCGFGLATFIFNFVSTYLANPHELQAQANGYFPVEVGNRVPRMIRVLSLCWFCIATAGLVLVFPYKEEQQQKYGDQEKVTQEQLLNEIELGQSQKLNMQSEYEKGDNEQTTQATQPITASDCFKSKQFILLYVMMTQSIFIGLFVINTYKKYGQHHIKDDHFLTMLGAIASIFGGIRFGWTWLVDKYSFKLSYTIILCINVFFGFTLVFASHYKALFLIWVCMIYWAEGAHFALVPTACSKLFGNHAAIVYGFAFSFAGFSSILTSILVKFMLQKVGYEPFYYIGSGLSLLSLIYLRLFFEEKKFC